MLCWDFKKKGNGLMGLSRGKWAAEDLEKGPPFMVPLNGFKVK